MRREETGAALLAGVCFGAAVATRLTTGAVVVPAAMLMMATLPAPARARCGAALIAGAAPFVVLVLWFNDLRTGSPWIPALLHPKYGVVQPGQGNWIDGLFGTLVSPGKSFFAFSPILILSVAGFPRFWREARADAIALGASLLLFLAAHAGIPVWTGDWGWGPRYSILIIPLLWLPGALLVGTLRPRTAARRAAAALIAVSLAVQCVPLMVNWHFQYQRMWVEGRLTGATPWRADNQLTDAIRAVPANVARTFGADIPAPEAVPGTSRMTYVASTGINVWWITALRGGLPPLAIWPAVLALAGVAAVAWRRAWRAAR